MLSTYLLRLSSFWLWALLTLFGLWLGLGLGCFAEGLISLMYLLFYFYCVALSLFFYELENEGSYLFEQIVFDQDWFDEGVVVHCLDLTILHTYQRFLLFGFSLLDLFFTILLKLLDGSARGWWLIDYGLVSHCSGVIQIHVYDVLSSFDGCVAYCKRVLEFLKAPIIDKLFILDWNDASRTHRCRYVWKHNLFIFVRLLSFDELLMSWRCDIKFWRRCFAKFLYIINWIVYEWRLPSNNLRMLLLNFFILWAFDPIHLSQSICVLSLSIFQLHQLDRSVCNCAFQRETLCLTTSYFTVLKVFEMMRELEKYFILDKWAKLDRVGC